MIADHWYLGDMHNLHMSGDSVTRSSPPLNLVEIIRQRLADPSVVLGGFRTIIDGSDGRPLKFMTWHHNVKV